MKKAAKTTVWVGDAHSCLEIRYLTGYAAVDPAMLVMRGRRGILVVSRLDVVRARKTAGSIRVCSPEDLKMPARYKKRLSGRAIAAIQELGARRVSVPEGFPVGIAQDLEKSGIGVSVVAADTLVDRSVKTPGEIRKIAEVQRAAVAGMLAAIGMLRRSRPDAKGHLRLGRTTVASELVRHEIEKVLFEHGCDTTETIVAGGRQAVDPHEPGHGPLHANEAIVIDIFPQSRKHGYWGDLTRTVVRGTAPAPLREQYRAVMAAHSAALRRVKAGISAASVHRAAADEFVRRGFETKKIGDRYVGFRHGLGHGVGLRVHEAPSVTLSGKRLKKGNVITIEPGLYYPATGGVRIEDTVVVTATGWRYLASCAKKLEV